MPIKAIVTDIEGTTSAVSFVYDVLFPYAGAALPGFIQARHAQPDVAAALDAVRTTAHEPHASVDRVTEILVGWMTEDLKTTALKALQGMVWQQGYASGELKGHVYPDAVTALQRWHQQGYKLYVYSSGSIQAQQLIFGCSEAGDLTGLFSGYFDTTTGPKREAPSYQQIAEQIGLPARDILFLSDIAQELDAARGAGMQTCGVVRGERLNSSHQEVANFSEIEPDNFH